MEKIMAKYNRIKVGDIYKGQVSEDGVKKPDYLKLSTNQLSRDALVNALTTAGDKGVVLNLHTKAEQLASLNDAEAAGKIKGEWIASKRERLTSIPDFIRFELILVQKQD